MSDDPPAISVRNFTKVYGSESTSVRAVDDISFDVQRGSIVGFLGPNGAGKTTTIKAMLGLIIPTEGEIHVDDQRVGARPQTMYKNVSAVLEGARNIYWRLTPLENMQYFASLQGRDVFREDVLEEFRSILRRLNIEEKIDVPVNKLSRGMKQKISMACAFARNTSILFLDEPTLGLDVEASLEIRNELQKLMEQDPDRTIVLSSHDMDVVQDLSQRVIILQKGQIIANETVDRLIDLFHSHAYRFKVDTNAEKDVINPLQNQYNLRSHESLDRNQCTFEVTVEEKHELYGVIEILREENASIQSIDTITPDLEDVFLRLTQDQNESGSDAESTSEPRTPVESISSGTGS